MQLHEQCEAHAEGELSLASINWGDLVIETRTRELLFTQASLEAVKSSMATLHPTALIDNKHSQDHK